MGTGSHRLRNRTRRDDWSGQGIRIGTRARTAECCYPWQLSSIPAIALMQSGPCWLRCYRMPNPAGVRARWICGGFSLACSTSCAAAVLGSWALAAPRLRPVVHGLPRLPPEATGRSVGTAPSPAPGIGAPTGGTGANAERRHHRQSIGEDPAGRPARLRRHQEGERPQAPSRGGYAWPALLLKVVVHPADLHDRVGGQARVGDPGRGLSAARPNLG